MQLYLIFCELQLLHESRILPVPTTSFPSDILGALKRDPKNWTTRQSAGFYF